MIQIVLPNKEEFSYFALVCELNLFLSKSDMLITRKLERENLTPALFLLHYNGVWMQSDKYNVFKYRLQQIP